MDITAYKLAERFIGIREMSDKGKDHPLVQWWLSLCGFSLDTPDEVAWCSAFVNGIAWELRLPRSKSAAARSWLTVGKPITLSEARADNDIVIVKRGPDPQPGPEVTSGAQGHVGFFSGVDATTGAVMLLAGNQGNSVSIQGFSPGKILGIRRLD